MPVNTIRNDGFFILVVFDNQLIQYNLMWQLADFLVWQLAKNYSATLQSSHKNSAIFNFFFENG